MFVGWDCIGGEQDGVMGEADEEACGAGGIAWEWEQVDAGSE